MYGQGVLECFQVDRTMTMLYSEQEILKSLDTALGMINWKGPPSDISHLSCPQHLASFKILGNQEQVTSERIVLHALKCIEKNEKIRVCSIGCDNGTLDKLILEGLKAKKVQYVGLDSDEAVVEGAMERLLGVSPNIKVNTLAVDYEDVNALRALSLEPFDFIWMVNCTYYASSLTSLLQGALQLLKPAGIALIISSSKQSLEQLVTRFWSHQRQDQLHTTESVVKSLTHLGVTHHIYREPVTFDLTAQFKDGFKSPASEVVLDHLVFCRLADYPPEIKELVIKFLQSIAKSTETSSTIISMSDLIYISQ